jgi:HEPN domain-containing protein
MIANKMLGEAERWLETASEDLRAARTLRQSQLFAHACFMAQQCGEKSIKAMWYAIDQVPVGQSIQKLVMQFPEPQKIPDMELWRQHAAMLDKFYSATRYPNELLDLTPGQSYFALDADPAIEYANQFLRQANDWVRASQPAQPSSSSVPERPLVSVQSERIDSKISVAPTFTPAGSRSLVPLTPTSVSSGEHSGHRRRRSHSWQSQVKRFVTQRETWVLVIVLIIVAILLGLLIAYGLPGTIR